MDRGSTIGVSSMNTTNSHRFFVDAGDLRIFFDRLSSALTKSSLLAKERTIPVDKAETVTTNGLKAVVDAVQHRQASTSIQSVKRDPHFASTLRLLTTQLRDNYRACIEKELGSKKVEFTFSLLSEPVPNFLDVLGKLDAENSHSDLIRWLLDPRKATTVAPAALHALVTRLPKQTEWQGLITSAIQHHALSVRREHAFTLEETGEENEGRLDLLISGPGFRLVIENKVGSDEHDNQTELYWQWLERQPGLKGGLFLSPAGFLAQNKHFKELSYVDLLNCLLEGPTQAPMATTEKAVLSCYVKALAAGILRQEFSIIGHPRGES